jgi:hypothetical protein
MLSGTLSGTAGLGLCRKQSRESKKPQTLRPYLGSAVSKKPASA